MGVVGMFTGGAGESHDGIAMDAHEPFGLADAAALAQVGQHGVGLVVGEPAVEQRRALALGEAGLAGLAVEQSDVVVLAVAVTDREVPGAAPPVQRAVAVMAAETREVVHEDDRSREESVMAVRSEQNSLDILRSSLALCSVIPGHDRRMAQKL